ncbi:MAG: apolipoprotein acyltransferase [Rubripirellula sp.]|jgi:hypothetical protein
MTPEQLIQRCHDLIGSVPEDADPSNGESLIGFFQSFRPDGLALQGIFDGIPVATELQTRLDNLFIAAGNDRRPEGGRDAYFVIRKPEPLDPTVASELTQQWLDGIRQFAKTMNVSTILDALQPDVKVRVLEGIPPKHPKDDAEKSNLLKAVQQDTSHLVEKVDAGPLPAILRPAYYFTACDAMLRDYLMWPFYANATGLADPLAPYFELWRHRAKYRIFGESQIDLYLPWHPD